MRLTWDPVGLRTYETGTDRGVLYPQDAATGSYPVGVAWNGLIGVTQSPSGADPTALWANNSKYLNLISAEEFGATIEAYTYPDEFAECDGSAEIAPGVYVGQQVRRPFGLSCRTLVGNDTEGTAFGYKIHIIYNATAAPSDKGYSTVNDSPEAITFSWTVSTVPMEVPGMRPTASITIDSTKVDPVKLAELEEILYGTSTEDARLPLPSEIALLVGVAASG